MTTTKENSIDRSTTTNKLNHELIQLLEGLNQRKSRIDDQVKFLTNLPKILPFEPLPPNPSIVSRKTWEAWWSEHDRIEREAGIFREDEFALMKKVAMSKTTNMSREDTDLVGLTLCTLEAFSKLEHLLRSRRKQLQILDLRIKWDQQTAKVWHVLGELESELPNFLPRIRWSPPSKLSSIFSSPHQSPSFSLPSSVLSCSHDASSHSTASNHLSRSVRSRKEGFRAQPPPASVYSPSLTSFPASMSDPVENSSKASCHYPHSPHTTPSRPDSSMSLVQSSMPAFQADLNALPSNSPHPSGCIRASSAPTVNGAYTSPIAVPSSSSPQSRAMRIQSLTLQLSSITTKFHTLTRSVVPTSTTIDKLIDSGLHVPEIFLDLQDKLEAAVRNLEPDATSKFYVTLMEQYKEADDIWFYQFHLELEADSLKRDVNVLLAGTQVDEIHLAEFETRLDQLLKSHASQHTRTQLRILPNHPNYPEQSELNLRLTEDLVNNSKLVKESLDELEELVRTYRLATEASQEANQLRTSMEEVKQKLMASIKSIDILNQVYPNRSWLMNNPSCLTADEHDVEYEVKWERILVELKESLVVALKLMDSVPIVLRKLNSLGIDPNQRSEFQQIRDGLKNVIDQAQQISTVKDQATSKLKQVRSTWGKILETEEEMTRLREQILVDAHREKWKMRKVTSPSPSLPILPGDSGFRSSGSNAPPRQLQSLEVLRSATPQVPHLLHSPQEAQEYISMSLQPLMNSALAALSNDSSQCAVYQHLTKRFDDLLNVQIPNLLILEQMIGQIRRQTSEVQKVESEYDAKIIEGGRWMKRVQDRISSELEHTYEEVEETGQSVGGKAPSEAESNQTQMISRLTNYLSTIDDFCNSFPSRIPFIITDNLGALVMANGRVAIDCPAHDQSLRSHLNGLSMTLMGLKDQISNEAHLLQWINSPLVREFEQGVNQVAKEIERTDVSLGNFESNVERIQHLIESDFNQPFLSDEQVQQQLDQPLQEIRAALNEIELRLRHSVSVQLEAFIASCPSSSISQAFKPDQFILPKQRSHHRLEAHYNQVCRRLEDVHALSMRFKQETNARRKQEFNWKQIWTQSIDEMIGKCGTLADDILTVMSGINTVEQELNGWKESRFSGQEQADLVALEKDCLHKYLDGLLPYESSLSLSQEKLQKIRDEIDLVAQRAESVRLDIEEKAPVFVDLVSDLVAQVAQLRDQCSIYDEARSQISSVSMRLKLDVEGFLAEFDRRLRWKAQCLEITKVELHHIVDSMMRFDGSFDEVMKSWSSDYEHTDREAMERIICSLLDSFRSLENLWTIELASIHFDIKDFEQKVSLISQEVLELSDRDAPHSYLIQLESQVNQKAEELGQRLGKLGEAEKGLLQLILLSSRQSELWSIEWLEKEIIRKHCDSEKARLTHWKFSLDQFIDSVQNECEQLEQFRLPLKPPQSQVDTESCLPNSPTLIETVTELSVRIILGRNQHGQIKGLIKLISEMTQRLEVLDLNKTRLASDIDFFRRTLPGVGIDQLEAILCFNCSQTDENESNRFEVACNKLREIRNRLKILGCDAQSHLESTQEDLKELETQLDTSERWTGLFRRLNQLDLDNWIDPECNTAHSPLPTPAILDHVLIVLTEAENEITEVCRAGLPLGQSSSSDIVALLESQKQKSEVLRQLVDFQGATSNCDQAFSNLLNYLDIRRSDTAADKIRDMAQSVSKALSVILKASDPLRADPRVRYHVTRSQQTWEELESLTKEVKAEPKALRRSLNGGTLDKSPPSKVPLPSRSGALLPGLTETPPMSSSQRGSFIPRLKHSSDMVMSRFESPVVSNSPMSGLLDSPSLAISRRSEIPRPPDPTSPGRVNRTMPKSESNTFLASSRSLSRQSDGKKPKSMMNNLPLPRERLRLHSIQGTPSRCPPVKSSLKRSSIGGNPNVTPNVYKPQPNRNIDRLVGNVVNKLARNQLRVHVAPADGWEDNSGMYWIGEKIYFCRILRSQTVMVRIGGGWSELSVFLMEHLRLTSSGSNKKTQLELRTAGGSERLATTDQVGGASTDNPFLRPMANSRTRCNSSPNHAAMSSSGGLTDSLTSTPTSSIATTVLISTPQDNRTGHAPYSSNERSGHLYQSTSQSKPFLSTPTETIQMFLRKAETRNYLTNNYTNSPTNQPLHHSGLPGDPIIPSSHTKPPSRSNPISSLCSLPDSNSLTPLSIKTYGQNNGLNSSPSTHHNRNTRNNKEY